MTIFTFDRRGDNFDGIFRSVGNRTKPEEFRKFVKVDGPFVSERGKPIDMINHSITSTDPLYNWISTTGENTSFIVTFLKNRIKMSGYSFKSRTDLYGNYPAEWIVEGSNNKKNWEFIHHHERSNEIASKGAEGTWNCTSSFFYKSIKVTQLGSNAATVDNKYYFSMYRIEFFGKISSSICSMAHNKKCISLLTMIASILLI